jgi:hypothetical protein
MSQSIFQPNRRQHVAVGLALLMIISGLVSMPFTGQATSVGLLEAKWNADRVVGLSDQFSTPTCDEVETTFNQVDILGEYLVEPYSSAIDGPQAIQDDWTVGVLHDETLPEPWSLSLFDSQGQELRYVTEVTGWMNEIQFGEYALELEVDPAPLFLELPVFVSNAQILAAHADALLFRVPSSVGSNVILLSNVEINETGLSFVPTDEFNDCINGEIIVDASALTSSYQVQTAELTQETPMLMSEVSATENRILGNEYLRFGYFGDGHSNEESQKNSITSTGNLSQPWYHNSSPSREGWYKLTFSDYPLNMAFGSGTGGTNWTGASVEDIENLPPVSQIIDWNGWVRTSPEGAAEAYGHGIVIVDTEYVLNGDSINIRNKYTLGQTASFVKIDTTVTNLDTTAISNFHIWTGTRDDYVAVTDGPLKYRGNINSAGDFEVSESRTAQASSLLVTSKPRTQSDGDAVLFYSTTAGTNMIVDECCGFDNVVDQDPSVGPSVGSREYDLSTWNGSDYSFDGSYGLVLPMGTIEPDASKTITWFYAGGSTGSLAEITRSVGAAAAPAAPNVSRSSGAATLTWDAPSIESGTEIVGYEYRYSTDGGSTWESAVSAGVNRSLTVSGLTNTTRYSFQVRAITQAIGDSSTSAPGEWSGSSVAEILGAPAKPTITVVRGGDSQVVVTYPAATLPSGVTSPVSGYQYCLSNCASDASWLTLSSSPATITGLTNGQGYNLRIRALNSNGASLASEILNFETSPTWTNGSAAVTVVVDRGDSIEDEMNSDDIRANSGVTYSTVSALPAWLTLNPSTGELSGETDVGGKYIIDLVATNSAGSTTKRFVFLVIPYVVLSPSPMTLNLGSVVNQRIMIVDGVIGDLSEGAVGEVTGLPDGLTASITSERVPNTLPSISILGTPTTLGTTTITVSFVMGDGAIAEFEILVTIAPASRPSGSGGGSTILPTPLPTPTLPTPTPSNPSQGPITPSPSPTPQIDEVFSVMVQFPATPNVVYSAQNPVPTALSDLLSRPIAYPDSEAADSVGLPELAPSDSVAFENGLPVVIQLVETDESNGYVLIGDGWEVALEATDSSGEPLFLDDSGNIVLNNDRFVQFTGTGFAPGSQVKVWLFSDPVGISDVVADASGNFVGNAQIPQGIPTGEHTIQLNGLTKDGQLRTVSLGVLIQPSTVISPAPPIGFDLSGLLNILWLIAALVVVLFFILWRRKRKQDEEAIPNSAGTEGDLIFTSESFQPSQQFPDDSRRLVGPAAPPNRKRFSFKPKNT